MATIKQIDANRRNALKSTGPRTPEGKAAVRMNSLQHGLRARTVVLPGENRDEFQQLCDDLEAEWQPQSRTEDFYLEQMAVSQWKLNRMEAGEANLCKETTISKTQVPLLDRLWQAQSRMERSYSRAQRELERLQNSRRNQVQAQLDKQQTPAPQSVAEDAPAPEPTESAPIIPIAAAPTVPAPVIQNVTYGTGSASNTSEQHSVQNATL